MVPSPRGCLPKIHGTGHAATDVALGDLPRDGALDRLGATPVGGGHLFGDSTNSDEPSVGPERRQSCSLWPVVGRRPVNRDVHRVKDFRSESFAIIRVIRGHKNRASVNCPPIAPIGANLLFVDDRFAMIVGCSELCLAVANCCRVRSWAAPQINDLRIDSCDPFDSWFPLLVAACRRFTVRGMRRPTLRSEICRVTVRSIDLGRRRSVAVTFSAIQQTAMNHRLDRSGVRVVPYGRSWVAARSTVTFANRVKRKVRVKRNLQFRIRSVLVFTTLVALALAFLPQIQAVREASRRSQNVNTFRQHSGFHPVGCDSCRDCIVNLVRGTPGYTSNVQTRLIFIGYATEDPNPTPEIIDALTDATRDNSKRIRDSAIAAIELVNADSQPKADDQGSSLPDPVRCLRTTWRTMP